jgi:rod shape-determining protein MreD
VILSPGTFLRVGLLVLLAVLLQVSFLADLRPFGGAADLVPLVVAAAGLFGGSTSGAATGFAAGLLLDASIGVNLGASSLVLTVVGYGTGRFRERRDPAHGLIALPVGGAATAVYLLGVGVVNFMLDLGGAEVSPLVFRDMIVTSLLNAALALPVFALVRRVLTPVIIGQPLAPRRRARRAEPAPIGLRGFEV